MANAADLYNGSRSSITPTGGSALAAKKKSASAAATDTALKTSFLDTGGTMALKAGSSTAEKAAAVLALLGQELTLSEDVTTDAGIQRFASKQSRQDATAIFNFLANAKKIA